MNNIWQLKVVDASGGSFVICGDEETMRLAYEEWKRMARAPDGTTDKLFEVHGMSDSADRAEATTSMLVSHIVGVFLVKLY